MTRRAWLLAMCVGLGCKTAPEVGPEAAPPTVPQQDFIVVNQNLTDCSVRLTGALEATTEQVFVEKATFEFVVDGKVLKTGELPMGVTVAPGQRTPFVLEQNFTYVKDTEDLKAMDARGGSLLMSLRGKLLTKVTTPAQGDVPAKTRVLELDFARGKEVRTPRLPHIKLQEFEAGRFSESEVQAVFHVGVVNPNPFEITLSSLSYEVTLAGKKVSEGTLGTGERVSPASTGVFDVSATINEETHGTEVKKLIKALVVPFSLKGELKTVLYSEPLSAQGQIKLTASKE